MPSDKRPYWYEPAWVSQMMNRASAEEATWSQADFEAKFAEDEDSIDSIDTLVGVALGDEG